MNACIAVINCKVLPPFYHADDSFCMVISNRPAVQCPVKTFCFYLLWPI